MTVLQQILKEIDEEITDDELDEVIADVSMTVHNVTSLIIIYF